MGSHDIDDRRDRVLVVGAGSSGLAAAKNLRERGFAVDVIEREQVLGGNWNVEVGSSRVYDSTYMISSKPFTQFPDFPMSDADPDYLHHTQVLAYLQRYAAHFGVDRLIELGTEVTAARPLSSGGWQVELSGPEGAATRSYGHLVVANGHNWHPKWPTYPGQDTFTGELIHAADHQHADRFDHRRVVVIGAGNTGCDLAVEAAQRASAVHHSTRRSYWYAPKYTMGRPTDQVSELIFSLRLPMRLTQALFEATARLTVGRYERFGLPTPDHRFLETHPIVNQQLLYHVGHGAITPVPDIDHFDGDEVVFTDGERTTADLVVFATGYLIRFPFLADDTFPGEPGRPLLYRNVLHPDRGDISVIGLIQPDSGQFCLVHWQTVLLARCLELQRQDPAAAREYLARARAHLDERGQGGIELIDSTRHYVEVEHADYIRLLARDIHELEGRLATAVAA
ncbi:MAG: flavin-containing monooxygenase [Nitriliruptoraceae bacterium]